MSQNKNNYVLNTRGRLKIFVDSPTPEKGLKYYQWNLNQDLGIVDSLKAFYYEGIFESLMKVLNDPTLNHTFLPENHLKFFQTLGIIIPQNELAEPVSCIIPLTTDLELELPKDLVINPMVWIQNEKSLDPFKEDILKHHHRFTHSPPIIWLSDPLTQMHFPYQGTPDIVQALEKNNCSSLPPETIQALFQARILVSIESHSIKSKNNGELLKTHQETLYSEGFLVLRNLIPSLFLKHIRSYLKSLSNEGYYQPHDDQVELRHIIHNEPLMEFIHHQMSHCLNSIVLEPIKPSYTFLSAYLPGAILKNHRDRSQCAWNVSLAMDMFPEKKGEDVWPFFIKTKKENKILLDMGDAVIYQGNQLFHWREALSLNEKVTMCLFHFVDQDYEGSLE